VEVKIGIQSVPREIVLETSATAEEVERALKAAVADNTVLVLQDDKGGRTLVPADKIAYLELSDNAQRRVGFGASL
jgi:DNA-binding transcriptional regulator/RsmH inhibitor MraZ